PIRPVRDEAAVDGGRPVGVDSRQLVLGGELQDQMTMNRRRRAPRYDKPAIRSACEGRDAALDLARVAHINRAHLHPELRCEALDGATGNYGISTRQRIGRTPP